MLTEERSKTKPLAAYLVGVQRDRMPRREAEEHLEELRQLALTYGVPVVGDELAAAEPPQATYLVGTGKAAMISERAAALDAQVIIFDDVLSPSQQRNWEKLTGLAVIDRQEVILGIFADRAQTKEARLQIELARAEYSLPRLKRAWTHLERQRGGGTFRAGAGEAQIEVDRRLVGDRILKLKKDLDHVRRVRATQRKARLVEPVPTAALIGYTNAGKSSIMRRLTGAQVLVEDKLFATLDPTTRRVDLPSRRPLAISDTVGFIRKLPHALVDAFKATLEEVQMATFLVHVVDASHPQVAEHIAAANAVLEELEVLDRPTIHVLNKVDQMEDRTRLSSLFPNADHVVAVSAHTGEGMDRLMQLLDQFAQLDTELLHLRIPADRGDLLSFVHREGHVTQQHFEEDTAHLEAIIPRRHRHRIQTFIERSSYAAPA